MIPENTCFGPFGVSSFLPSTDITFVVMVTLFIPSFSSTTVAFVGP